MAGTGPTKKRKTAKTSDAAGLSSAVKASNKKPRETKAETEIERPKAGDIDAIFEEAKTRKQATKSVEATTSELGKTEASRLQPKKSGQRKPPNPSGDKAPPAVVKSAGKSRKRTEEGYTVYTEDELKWNKKNAGGTKLCPFDCDCCF